MMKPSYILGEARVPSSKFKAVLGDHIPREELKRLKASLEAMDLSPDHHDIYYDYQDHYYDGFGGDFNNQEPTQRPQLNSWSATAPVVHCGGISLPQKRVPGVCLNTIPPSLSTITPIPSSTLSVSYRGKVFTITLDSGATVSFISNKLFRMLKVPLYPNGQLAQLALPHIRAASLGEIDIVAIEASTNRVCLRLRALVMPELSVPCYGGRTFERDNGIVDNVSREGSCQIPLPPLP